jgi:hypothetical protein
MSDLKSIDAVVRLSEDYYRMIEGVTVRISHPDYPEWCGGRTSCHVTAEAATPQSEWHWPRWMAWIPDYSAPREDAHENRRKRFPRSRRR